MQKSFAVWLATTAFAMPVHAAAQAQTASPENAAQVATHDADDGNDIIVTATRRTQNTLDVPVAVSTYAPEQIARSGINDVKRMTSIAPSLNVSNTQGESAGVQIRVRGIGTSGSNPGLESATGVSIDGVFLARSNVALNDLLGVERIELLRGPQGTLFGKNTTAGVINIITRSPSFTPGMEASLTTGNYDLVQTTASLTGPLAGDVVAGRIDAIYTHRDGWLGSTQGAEPYANRNRYRLRGQLLFEPADGLSLRVIADYSRHNENTQNPPLYRVAGPTAAIIGALGQRPIATWDAPKNAKTQIDALAPRFDKLEDAGISAQLEWKVGPGTLTSITAYRDTIANRSYDGEGSPIQIFDDPRDGERYRTFSQETRYHGTAGILDYLVGVYYSRDKIRSRDSITFGKDYERYVGSLYGSPTFFPTLTGLPEGESYPAGASGWFDEYHQKSTSFALFSQNTVRVTDRLALTGGLRWTTETKDLDASLFSQIPACSALLPRQSEIPAAYVTAICGTNSPTMNGDYQGRRKQSAFSGVVAANWRISDGVSLYGTYGRGYKAGGYNYDRSSFIWTDPKVSQLEFGGETADSFEAGVKTILWDRQLRINVSAFHTSISGYQFNYLRVQPTVTNRVTANLPEFTSRGVELETSLQLFRKLTINGALTFQDVKYGGDLAEYPGPLAQLHGTRAPFAPKWVASGSVNYDQPIGDALKAFAYVDAQYQSRANLSYSATTSADYFQAPYALVNGRVGIGDIDDHLTLELWARNLFNKRVWTGLYQATSQSGSIEAFVNEPRFYGVTLRTKF
jgi:outer membrane receptor protein involved in Fe transport